MRALSSNCQAVAATVLLLAGCRSGQADFSRGGTELVYTAPAGTDEAGLTQARSLVAARLQTLGVASRVKVDGAKLRVALPAAVAKQRLAEVKELLAVRGVLEVREVTGGAALRELQATLPEGGEVTVERDSWETPAGAQQGVFYLDATTEEAARPVLAALKAPEGTAPRSERGVSRVRYYLLGPAALGNAELAEATAGNDVYLPPEVVLRFTDAGARKYEEFTRRLIGRKRAIVLDDRIVEAVVVTNAGTTGRTSLTVPEVGDKQARHDLSRRLAAALRHGPLPFALTLEEERELPRGR